MSAVQTVTGRTATMYLINGTDSSGNPKYITATLGKLKAPLSAWDLTKAEAIISPLATHVLSNNFGYMVVRETSRVTL